jgi:hypothetical protein
MGEGFWDDVTLFQIQVIYTFPIIPIVAFYPYIFAYSKSSKKPMLKNISK